MDLRMHLSVLWRFRFLVIGGLILACVLTLLTIFRVSFHGARPTFSYRQSETWQSREVLFISQNGFPYGWATNPFVVGKNGQPLAPTRFGDPGRYIFLAQTYSQLANGDAVYAEVRKHGPVNGVYVASPVIDKSSPGQSELPLINVDALSTKPKDAVSLAQRASNALIEYLRHQQQAAHIPVNQRISVDVASTARAASLAKSRKYTAPIVLFLVILIATIALAYVLENLRPRVKALPSPATEDRRTPEAPAEAPVRAAVSSFESSRSA